MADGKLIVVWEAAGDDYQMGQLRQLDRPTPLKLILQFFSHRNISYLTTRPKTAQIIAHAAKQHDVEIKIDTAIAVGASKGENNLHECLEAFGAKICALYSSKEGHKMAYQCPSGVHYHQKS